MKIIVLHDETCPLSQDAVRAFIRACESLSYFTPNSHFSNTDRELLAETWRTVQLGQRCICGAEAEIKRRERLTPGTAEPAPLEDQ